MSAKYELPIVEHPGVQLREILEAWGWTQAELARRTGLHRKLVCTICGRKSPITARTALALERATGRPAHFWMNLQNQFDLARERARWGKKKR